AALVGDGRDAELALVADVVRDAEVAEGVLVAGHALDDRVVVLAGVVVLAALLLLAVDRFGEEVERAGIGAGTVQVELLRGPARIDILPGLRRVVGLPHLLELVERELPGPGVLRVDDDRDAVPADLHFGVVDAVLLAVLGLGGLDRPRGVGEVGLAVGELLEAAAGAGDADGDVDGGVFFLELRGDGLGDQ